jgi:hypothetical protein
MIDSDNQKATQQQKYQQLGAGQRDWTSPALQTLQTLLLAEGQDCKTVTRSGKQPTRGWVLHTHCNPEQHGVQYHCLWPDPDHKPCAFNNMHAHSPLTHIRVQTSGTAWQACQQSNVGCTSRSPLPTHIQRCASVLGICYCLPLVGLPAAGAPHCLRSPQAVYQLTVWSTDKLGLPFNLRLHVTP